MATIRKEIRTRACPDAAWDAMRDIGALHERLVVGFVVDTKLDGKSNTGHNYPDALSQEEKQAVLEYLKTL